MLNEFVKLVNYTSTPSQHVIRFLTILAAQDCIVEGKSTNSGTGCDVQFADIREKLYKYAPIMLRPVKGNGNDYCYAQADAWTRKGKALETRCTEYAREGANGRTNLEKDWVNVFDRSVLRNRVMHGLFSQTSDSFFIERDMAIFLNSLRVPIRDYLVSKIASKMISLSAYFLGKSGPRAANMGSESIATGVVWEAIGLGKSASRGTSFAKKLFDNFFQAKLDCVYCRSAIQQVHMDHVMSFYHGGYSCHHAGNLIPSCAGCNQTGRGGKGANYLGLDGWVRIKDFYGNNPGIVTEIKQSMSSTGSRRQITWVDWWDEVIEFYSDHLEGMTVWNPGSPNPQLTKRDLSAIRQILENIKQK